MIERRPLWPPGPPPSRKRSLPNGSAKSSTTTSISVSGARSRARTFRTAIPESFMNVWGFDEQQVEAAEAAADDRRRVPLAPATRPTGTIGQPVEDHPADVVAGLAYCSPGFPSPTTIFEMSWTSADPGSKTSPGTASGGACPRILLRWPVRAATLAGAPRSTDAARGIRARGSGREFHAAPRLGYPRAPCGRIQDRASRDRQSRWWSGWPSRAWSYRCLGRSSRHAPAGSRRSDPGSARRSRASARSAASTSRRPTVRAPPRRRNPRATSARSAQRPRSVPIAHPATDPLRSRGRVPTPRIVFPDVTVAKQFAGLDDGREREPRAARPMGRGEHDVRRPGRESPGQDFDPVGRRGPDDPDLGAVRLVARPVPIRRSDHLGRGPWPLGRQLAVLQRRVLRQLPHARGLGLSGSDRRVDALPRRVPGVLPDYPSLTSSSDKIVIADNLFTPAGRSSRADLNTSPGRQSSPAAAHHLQLLRQQLVRPPPRRPGALGLE